MIERPEFVELGCENAAKLLARDDLDIDNEIDLFEAVMK